MERRKFKELIQESTRGFLTHSTEMILYTLILAASGTGGRSPRAVYRATREASEEAFEIIHGKKFSEEDLTYDRFQKILYYLRHKGLVSSAKGRLDQIRITRAGRRRLAQKLPIFLTHRPWDGKIYLVTYDVPEEWKGKRDLLREYLQRLGCAMMQKSVWVSVYDPRELLREWSREYKLDSSIVVSDVGEDGSVAGASIPEIVARLYHLADVGGKYQAFLDYHDHLKPAEVDRWELHLGWLECLRGDPQLPFELLPSNFPDRKAYRLYQELADGGDLTQVLKEGRECWDLAQLRYSLKRSSWSELEE